MREPGGAGDIAAAFPRPGRVLKTLLILIAVFAVVGAVIVHWAPGGERGVELFSWLAFQPKDHHLLLTRPWTLLTSGLLTVPSGIGHAMWSLVGLYFLTPDLEKRWGGARLLRFLMMSVVIGNLFVLAGTFLPFQGNLKQSFSPPLVVGPMAAIVASTIAWAKENAHRQIRFMFVLPMSGKLLFWITIGMTLLALLFLQDMAEGALALLGGVTVGVLFGGTPSPVRAFWLRMRLGSMKKRGGITVEQLLNDNKPSSQPRISTGKRKGPPLRVVQGGLEEDLKNRKPPKDKRYLN